MHQKSLEVQSAFMECISTTTCEIDSCQYLSQIWLRQFVAEMMISMPHTRKPADGIVCLCCVGLTLAWHAKRTCS